MIESCKLNDLNAGAYINEMAHRSANEQSLTSPYQYSLELTEKVKFELSKELEGLKPPSG